MIVKLSLAMLLIVASFVVLSALAIAGNRVPLTSPPGFAARLAAYLTRNVVETSLDSPYPERRPHVLVALPESVLAERLREIVDGLGWHVRAPPGEAGAELWAVVRSPLFGFRDDVHVWVTNDADGRPRLQVRSASRVGRGDLGANTRHLLDLVDAAGRAGLLAR